MTKKAIVVGCGGMGRGWIKAVLGNPRAELAGLVDIRPEAAREAALKFGVDEKKIFHDTRKAIKTASPDFVVDVTVPEAHCPTTVASLKLGAPVVGEKPMAESMASARKMVKASERSGKLYMVSQSRRYDSNHAACRSAISEGMIGQVSVVNCSFYIGAHFGGFRDAMPSPLLLDMAIHHFDMCRFLTGADPVSVYTREFNPRGSWYRGDAAASCIFEMTGGIIFTYSGAWCSEGCHTSWNGDWRMVGERGTILLEKDQPPGGQRVKNPGQTGAFHLELEPVAVPAAQINGSGIAGALNEMLDYLDSGKKPQGECHDNIKSLAMVFSAIESARRGKRVEVKI